MSAAHRDRQSVRPAQVRLQTSTALAEAMGFLWIGNGVSGTPREICREDHTDPWGEDILPHLQPHLPTSHHSEQWCAGHPPSHPPPAPTTHQQRQSNGHEHCTPCHPCQADEVKGPASSSLHHEELSGGKTSVSTSSWGKSPPPFSLPTCTYFLRLHITHSPLPTSTKPTSPTQSSQARWRPQLTETTVKAVFTTPEPMVA